MAAVVAGDPRNRQDMLPGGAHSASRADMAYQRIEEMIVSRALMPGAMISENSLVAELGCGRTPIREALQRLKLEGYVEIHPRRGAQVVRIDFLQQLDLLEVRRPLEELAARLAAARAKIEERVALREAAERILHCADAGDRAGYLRANRAIHDLRAEATRNAVLIRILRPLSAMSRWFWYSQIDDEASFCRAAELHAQMAGAVADGEAEQAVSAARSLMGLLEELSRASFDRR